VVEEHQLHQMGYLGGLVRGQSHLSAARCAISRGWCVVEEHQLRQIRHLEGLVHG
jgi:hypothetical protein